MDMSDVPPMIAANIAEGEGVAVEIRGQSVFVCRSGGRVYAVSNQCTHAGSRLDGGKVCDGVVTCPLHGAKFRLSTGECLSVRRSYASLQTFPVREEGGQVHVDVP
jgi:nitrite reductase/ring-hydroxylating ferredoxin subunit